MTDGVAARFDSVAYPAADERALQSMLLHPSSATLARAGRRPGAGLEVTIGGTPEAATIAAGGGVIVESAVGGTYLFAIPSPVSITMPARPGSGTSRIDYVLARILNEDARPGDTLREVDLYLLSGTAGASPAAPTIPTGHLRIARLDVPASGTIAVSKPAPRMAAAGGIIIVTDSTERDAISPIFDGIIVYREDSDTFEGRINGAWVTIAGDSGWVTLASATVTGTVRYRQIGGFVTIQVTGTGSFTAAATIAVASAALPAAFRPSATVSGGAYFTGHPGSMTVNTDGTITAIHDYSGTTPTSLRSTLVYPLG